MQEPDKAVTKNPRILIVGASAAGASAAARARRLCDAASITLVERGPDISYAACGMPYHIGDEIAERSRLTQHTPAGLSTLLGVTVRTRTEAVAIDRARKILSVRRASDGATEELPYDKLILAPGAAPVRPPLPGIDNPRIHTLRTLQDMDAIKQAACGAASTALVVGAGFIGLEMAEQLCLMGLAITVVEMSPQVLPQLDPEMTRDIERELRSHDITLIPGDAVESFAAAPVTARLRSGREVAADLVVLCIGVKPESGLAAAAGLALGERGAIKVNEWLQTSDPDIYAAGDAVENLDRVFERPMNLALGGPANRQGRIIADHIFERNASAPGLVARPYPGHLGTAIVRVFDTAAGATGWTEKRLVAAGIGHRVTIVTDFQHAGYFPGAKPLTLKILWSPADGRLLGAQACGADGVDKRLDVLATALAARMTIDDLAQLELAYAPPFGSARDVVNTAGFAAQNQRAGLVPLAREIPAGRRILDVRPRAMAQAGPLPGALNIPLMELRSRLGEIDRSTRWAVVCLFGKTSYFAARTLAQNGFDVVSIAGGVKVVGHTD